MMDEAYEESKKYIDDLMNQFKEKISMERLKRKMKIKKTIKWLLRKALCIGSSIVIVFGMFGPSILGIIAVLVIDAVVSTEIKIWFKIETREKCPIKINKKTCQSCGAIGEEEKCIKKKH